MTHRLSFTKTVIAAAIAFATLGGSATVANAGQFSFSWSTPQGTFVIGPNHPNGTWQQRHIHHRHVAPRHLEPRRHARPQRQFQHDYVRPRQARRILRQAGFRDIHMLRDRRHTYLFEARGYRGYRIVAVNKYNGEIIWRPRHRFH